MEIISKSYLSLLVKRGYLVYDSNILLDIHSSIARTLYMLLEKIRFDELYVRESIFALIKKIPLKYEKKSLPVTIKTLEKAFNELKSRKLIKGFNFLKETTWLEADVEVYYDENHNVLKKERFEEDNNELKNIYNSLAISYTEKNVKEFKPKIIVNDEIINEIIQIMPEKAKKLKSIYKTVKDNLEKYGYEKVKAASVYLAGQKKLTSPRAYFLKILENNWADDIIETKSMTKQNTLLSTLETKDSINEKNQEYRDFLFSEFEKFPIDVQNGIESYVYVEYINLCGMETKIQKIAFQGSRKKLICDYLQKHPEILSSTENNLIEKKQFTESFGEDKKENLIFLTDKEKLKNYINEYITLYEELVDTKIESLEEIKKKIILDCMTSFLSKTLTLEKLEEIIRKHLM